LGELDDGKVKALLKLLFDLLLAGIQVDMTQGAGNHRAIALNRIYAFDAG